MDNRGMFQWPRNRREFWTLARRLGALLLIVGICAGGYYVMQYVIGPIGAPRNE